MTVKSKEEILEPYILNRSGLLCVEHTNALQAMQTYADQQTAALREEVERLRNGWASVEDRLPELGQSVLTYSEHDKENHVCKLVTYQEGSPGYAEGKRDKWFRYIALNTCMTHFKVTHWKLIEPPKS